MDIEMTMLKDVSQQSISYTEIFNEEINQLVSEFTMNKEKCSKMMLIEPINFSLMIYGKPYLNFHILIIDYLL